MTNASVNLYDNVYGDFASAAESLVRRETYGEDIGQSSWVTAPEWLRFADQLAISSQSDVLEVGSGSGGPAVYMAVARGCRLTGVDINEHGVRNAAELAARHGVSDRVQFRAIDASQPLPFPAGRFDAVVSNDAMCHIRERATALGEWYRVLRPEPADGPAAYGPYCTVIRSNLRLPREPTSTVASLTGTQALNSAMLLLGWSPRRFIRSF